MYSVSINTEDVILKNKIVLLQSLRQFSSYMLSIRSMHK